MTMAAKKYRVMPGRFVCGLLLLAWSVPAWAHNGPPFPIRSAETVFEASYIMQLAPWWSLQPDFQYIVKPGGNIPNPNDPPKAVGNAVVVGVRTTINF